MANPLKTARTGIGWSAKTVLPVLLGGAEVLFEAHAYQGLDPECQAIALVHRRDAAGAAADAAGDLLCGLSGGRPPGIASDGAGSPDMPLVRVHSGCVTGDVFHSLRCDCRAQLDAALERLTAVPVGVLLYLPYQEGRGIGLFNKIRAYALQDQGFDTVDANVRIGAPVDARDYAFAACILHDLGFDRIGLLTNNPAKVAALETEGIEVGARVPLRVEPGDHNRRYLETKRRRLAHEL